MKKSIFLILLVSTIFTVNSHATLLDFNDPNNLGVNLGGQMMWNGTGGGHLYDEYYDQTSSILFNTDTLVNSFELNNKPWQGYYTSTNISDYAISFFGTSGLIQSMLVDLTNYGAWNQWLTLNVNISGVTEIRFGAAGPSAWPSIDNLVINEGQSIPEPSAIALMGLGLLGFVAIRRKIKK